MKKKSTYKSAGVDLEIGESFITFLKSLNSTSISPGIGGFAGGINIDSNRFETPRLLACTDGVGTKILVAKQLSRYDTIGIDLVAMSANDLAVCGAKPLLFLDYIACGKQKNEVLKDIIAGILRGCEMAGCTLAGGETAEMPDVYSNDDIDLAGFCVGIVEEAQELPKRNLITPGDMIMGLPSSGIHANGLSLARKVIPKKDKRLWEELLVPTQIYVKEFFRLNSDGHIKGAAHITGGGLFSNIERILPEELFPEVYWNWKIPPIFDEIQKRGEISDNEMRKVFNMGIGLACVVSHDQVQGFIDVCDNEAIAAIEIGTIIKNG